MHVTDFLANSADQTALMVGTVAALVSALVGVFTVVRGQSFAGHSFADIGAAGGSGAVLIGLNPLAGFVAMNLVAAGIMDAIGIRRPHGRDLATGIVLGAALGLAALFLYLDTTYTTYSNATQTILFGSIYTLLPDVVPWIVGLAAASVAGILLLYRPLLLSSISSDLAQAQGVPVRVVGLAYIALLALAASLSSMTVGAILSTALLIGPAAAGLRLTARPGLAAAVAAAIGVGTVWLALLLAYDSWYWIPDHRSLPVSFVLVSLVFVVYLLADLATRIPTTSQTVPTT